MKYLSHNNGRRKKGVVFALDAAIAVTVVIIVLINSTYYFSTASKESLSQIQLIRLMGDALAVVDANGKLDNITIIDQNDSTSFLSSAVLGLSRYVPAGYSFTTEITNLHESIINNSAEYIKNPTTCGTTSCDMQNGGDIVVNTSAIEAPGNYYIQLNAAVIGDKNPKLEICRSIDKNCVNGEPTVQENILYDGPWIMGSGQLYLPAGVSSIKFKLTATGNTILNVTWFRVLGSEAYTKKMGSGGSAVQIPSDRFVGVVERPFIVKIGKTVSPYVARGYIWLQ